MKSNLVGGIETKRICSRCAQHRQWGHESLSNTSPGNTRFSRVISPACLLPSRGGGRVPKTISGRGTFLFLPVPRMTAQEGSGGQKGVRRTELCRPPSKRSVLFEAGTIVDVIELETICHSCRPTIAPPPRMPPKIIAGEQISFFLSFSITFPWQYFKAYVFKICSYVRIISTFNFIDRNYFIRNRTCS